MKNRVSHAVSRAVGEKLVIFPMGACAYAHKYGNDYNCSESEESQKLFQYIGNTSKGVFYSDIVRGAEFSCQPQIGVGYGKKYDSADKSKTDF